MDLARIETLELDDTVKGFPPGADPLALASVPTKGWSILRGDLPMPLLVLRASALDQNATWMKSFAAATGARLCPHGKTTMAPQLFARQLADGAWGITCANLAQLAIYRRFGVPRVLYANQLVSALEIGYVLRELQRDSGFDFYCLVDSRDGAHRLAAAVGARGLGRPLQVLLEIGVTGGRTGCRSVAEGLSLARHIRSLSPSLALRGVETFEGLVGGRDEAERAASVTRLVADLGDLAENCQREGLFAPGEVLVSAGGSFYLDVVAHGLAHRFAREPFRLVLRAGCYVTHDSGAYERGFREMLSRSPGMPGALAKPAPVLMPAAPASPSARAATGASVAPGARLVPALELWAHVVSRPEPTLVVVSCGKRDAPYDLGLPIARFYARPGMLTPAFLTEGHEAKTIFDQHLTLRVPEASPLAIGDLVGFGISHPCAAFEKWSVVYVVDDAYVVTGAVKTFF